MWYVTLQHYADLANEERETTLILGVYSGLGFSPTQNTHPKSEEPNLSRIQNSDNMMHANIYANIYNHNIIIINAINKAAKATKTILESARIDSLREDGPARGQLLIVPSRVASCRNAKNNRRKKKHRAATVRYLSERREKKRSK